MTYEEDLKRVGACQGEHGSCPCKTQFLVHPASQDPDNEEREQVGRLFDTGAYRDGDSDKLDYEGFFSPFVLRRRAEYMHKHRRQSNGELRDSDNWQLGIPVEQYFKSMNRHHMEVWLLNRAPADGEDTTDELIEALCALAFNVDGAILELLKERGMA